MKLSIGIAASLALLAEGALAQDRVELAPHSPWVVSYDADSCTLKRQFGEEGRQAYLELRQFGPSQDTQVTVASKDFRRRDGAYQVAFQPVDPEPLELDRFSVDLDEGYEGKLFSYRHGRGDPRVEAAMREFVTTTPVLTDEERTLVLLAQDLDPESKEYERLWQNPAIRSASNTSYTAFLRSESWQILRNALESETRGMLIERAFSDPLFLRTGNLHPAMEAMRSCLDDLYSHWGIDVDAHRTLRRPATPLDFARIVREITESYPRGMVRIGRQASLRVRLDVAPDGMPTGCHMQVDYNEDDFERVACQKLMRYARFAPALDKDGQPIASFYQTAIHYQLN